jgi:predicted transcriptional regulator
LIVDRHDEDDGYCAIAITDIANLVVAKNLPFDRVNVSKIMLKPILALHPGIDIHRTINIENRFKIPRAVVLENARTLLGIVALRNTVLRSAVAREGGK